MRLLACARHASAGWQLAALDVTALAAHALNHTTRVCAQMNGSRSIMSAPMLAWPVGQVLSRPAAAVR